MSEAVTEDISQAENVDVVVVGAGFAGLYLLYRLRKLGYRVRVLEQGTNVGGTWYWNRYPGARCDAESLAYSFSFSHELEQEWEWSERYATQPEIERYAQHVAERFDLRRDIRFNETVTSARFNDADKSWHVECASGLHIASHFCIMATGCLSKPQVPDIPGLDSFGGSRYQASQWPLDGVDFTGRSVGLIGTGSSGIQSVPQIAAQAKNLYVLQRTPNFSVPAENFVLDPEWVSAFKKNYSGHRHNHKHGLSSGFGDLQIVPKERTPAAETAVGLSDQEVAEILEPYWQRGGGFFLGAFGDTLLNEETNTKVADFVRAKIRETVNDPVTAECLCPKDHPIGTKRICVDTDYYATFNRPNVTLINLRETPIASITPTGIDFEGGQSVELDDLVLATGFDAMTGALTKIDIVGRDGMSLRQLWGSGPRAYLGLMIHGFPNMFTVTGPGSPSVLSNMMVSIEQHVDWIVDCLEHMKASSKTMFEADLEAQDGWVAHVNEVASATLFPRAGSWYMGANIPGKPRNFMPYAGGVGVYRDVCNDVVAEGYRGIHFV